MLRLVGSVRERIQFISSFVDLAVSGGGELLSLFKSNVREILRILCLRRVAGGSANTQLQKLHGIT